MTVHGVVGGYQQFESIYILLLQGTPSYPVCSEGKSSVFHRNVGVHLPDC